MAELVLARDAFGRTVTDGWGSADVGGAYSYGGVASRYSVSASKGRMLAQAGGTEIAYLNSVSSTSTRVRVAISSSTAHTGGVQSITVGARSTAAGIYSARVRIEADLLRLYILRDETTLAASTTIEGAYTPDRIIMLDVYVSGTSPTTVSAKMWYADTTEPASYQQTGTDSTSGMQVAGPIALRGAVSGSPATNPTISFDNLLVTDPTVPMVDDVTVTVTHTDPTTVGGSDGTITVSWAPVTDPTGQGRTVTYETALLSGTVTSGAVADDTNATSPKTYTGLNAGARTVAVRAKVS